MSRATDYFTWTQQLECLPNICNDAVKKILCKGIFELLWEDFANATFTSNKVIEIRKNILLYKLKNNSMDIIIQNMKRMFQLKSEEKELDGMISALEKQHKEQHFLVRKKVQCLRKHKSAYTLMKVRKNLLKMKYNETNTQLHDCADMKLVCKHLMPNTVKELDQGKVKECLDIVVSLCFGANKKQVREKISNMLGSIDTSTLWKYLYQNLLEDMDKLINLHTAINSDNCNSDIGENIDIGIAKACGQYICAISRKLLFNEKTSKHQQEMIEYIEKIEMASDNDEDLSDWLVLALEVRKLEVEQQSLQKELNIIKKNIDDNAISASDLADLTSDVQNISIEMEGYAKDIQQSLVLLKSATSLIIKTRDKLCHELQKIATMQIDNAEPKWLNDYLITELDIYHDILDLNALRKIMLKGDVGTYKHVKCCLSEASISIDTLPYLCLQYCFPMLQIPIYSLINCYKNIIAHLVYKKYECWFATEHAEFSTFIPVRRERNHYNSLELLQLSKLSCEKAQEEINQFNTILNAWIDQNVQEVMVLKEKTVDDLCFTDWLQQYTLLLYMVQNPK